MASSQPIQPGQQPVPPQTVQTQPPQPQQNQQIHQSGPTTTVPQAPQTGPHEEKMDVSATPLSIPPNNPPSIPQQALGPTMPRSSVTQAAAPTYRPNPQHTMPTAVPQTSQTQPSRYAIVEQRFQQLSYREALKYSTDPNLDHQRLITYGFNIDGRVAALPPMLYSQFSFVQPMSRAFAMALNQDDGKDPEQAPIATHSTIGMARTASSAGFQDPNPKRLVTTAGPIASVFTNVMTSANTPNITTSAQPTMNPTFVPQRTMTMAPNVGNVQAQRQGNATQFLAFHQHPPPPPPASTLSYGPGPALHPTQAAPLPQPTTTQPAMLNTFMAQGQGVPPQAQQGQPLANTSGALNYVPPPVDAAQQQMWTLFQQAQSSNTSSTPSQGTRQKILAAQPFDLRTLIVETTSACPSATGLKLKKLFEGGATEAQKLTPSLFRDLLTWTITEWSVIACQMVSTRVQAGHDATGALNHLASVQSFGRDLLKLSYGYEPITVLDYANAAIAVVYSSGVPEQSSFAQLPATLGLHQLRPLPNRPAAVQKKNSSRRSSKFHQSCFKFNDDECEDDPKRGARCKFGYFHSCSKCGSFGHKRSTCNGGRR